METLILIGLLLLLAFVFSSINYNDDKDERRAIDRYKIAEDYRKMIEKEKQDELKYLTKKTRKK